jgi:hypothetical protein
MRENGYVQANDNDAGANSYSLSPFHTVTEVDVGLDYDPLIQSCIDRVHEYEWVPGPVADFYEETFCTGTGLFKADPYTGEAVDITEDTGLQDAVNEATEAVAEQFDEPMFGADNDSAADPETQGTLAD